MLNHAGSDRWQLFDLVAQWLARGQQLFAREAVATATARRPVLDHLIHCCRGQQLAAVTLVPGLGALRAPRAILAPRRPSLARPVSARRKRGVPRALAQLTLKLLHA